jgi:adenine-specific DNA-methyltransferase
MLGRIYYPSNGNGVPALKVFKDEEQEYNFDTIIDEMGTFTDARGEIETILGNKELFDTPKPGKMLKEFVRATTLKDDIILDFFSGSATTAHAVMQLNAEDGGKRKFIMVQLPEVCAEGAEAAKAGYANICEIGKERIRRAGDKIKAEIAGQARNDGNVDAQNHDGNVDTQNLDIGFRVLKLDETNMNDVYYAASDYTQELVLQMENNIKPDRTDMDLLYGCLLDWGLPLSTPHTHEKIDGFTVHTYNEGDLIACFEERISEKAIREIAGRKPLRAVFRDSSFTSSPEKINVFEIFKLLAPNTNVRVI